VIGWEAYSEFYVRFNDGVHRSIWQTYAARVVFTPDSHYDLTGPGQDFKKTCYEPTGNERVIESQPPTEKPKSARPKGKKRGVRVKKYQNLQVRHEAKSGEEKIEEFVRWEGEQKTFNQKFRDFIKHLRAGYDLERSILFSGFCDRSLLYHELIENYGDLCEIEGHPFNNLVQNLWVDGVEK
jgi:hypothetical protein